MGNKTSRAKPAREKQPRTPAREQPPPGHDEQIRNERVKRELLAAIQDNKKEDFESLVGPKVDPGVVVAAFQFQRRWALETLKAREVSPALSDKNRADIAGAAYFEGELDMFQYALPYGASVNARAGAMGYPLSAAISFLELSPVIWLLENGARWDYSYVDVGGRVMTIGSDLDDAVGEEDDDDPVKRVVFDFVRGLMSSSGDARKIGEGDNNEVLGYDRLPGVAIKTAVEKYEADVTKKLSGSRGFPVVLLAIPSGEDEFDVFMERVTPWKGRVKDLQQLHDTADVSRETALSILRQIRDSYIEARRQIPDFVHGDLKAENVMLTGDGDEPRVVIIDLGAADIDGTAESSPEADLARVMVDLPKWRTLLAEDLDPKLVEDRDFDQWVNQMDDLAQLENLGPGLGRMSG